MLCLKSSVSLKWWEKVIWNWTILLNRMRNSPPESMWTLGITLWEVCSMGEIPFARIFDHQVNIQSKKARPFCSKDNILLSYLTIYFLGSVFLNDEQRISDWGWQGNGKRTIARPYLRTGKMLIKPFFLNWHWNTGLITGLGPWTSLTWLYGQTRIRVL